jgi:hypothetical protein
MSEAHDNHKARQQETLDYLSPKTKGYRAPNPTICSVLTTPMTHDQGDDVPDHTGIHAERLRVLRREKLAEVMVRYPHYVAWMTHSKNRDACASDFLMPPSSSSLVKKEHRDSIRDMQTLITLNSQYIKSGFSLSRATTEEEAAALMLSRFIPEDPADDAGAAEE